MNPYKVRKAVTPAQAVPPAAGWLPAEVYPRGSGGGNSENGTKRTYYESIIIQFLKIGGEI